MRVKFINHVITFIPDKKDIPIVKKWAQKQKNREVSFNEFLKLLLECPYDCDEDE